MIRAAYCRYTSLKSLYSTKEHCKHSRVRAGWTFLTGVQISSTGPGPSCGSGSSGRRRPPEPLSCSTPRARSTGTTGSDPAGSPSEQTWSSFGSQRSSVLKKQHQLESDISNLQASNMSVYQLREHDAHKKVKLGVWFLPEDLLLPWRPVCSHKKTN